MFIKLRNNFILLNMTIISILMIVAFTVIYIMTYVNIQNENYTKLQNLSSMVVPARPPIQIIKGSAEEQPVRAFIPKDYTLSFNIILDESNRLISIHSFVDMPEKLYENAAQLVMEAGNEKGKISLDDKLWLFIKKDVKSSVLVRDNNTYFGVNHKVNNYTRISFLDITESQKILTHLLLTFLAIGVVMLFVIWGISVFFAKRAVAPVELSYAKQKQFVADASHELKTPIAIINANTDALLTNKEKTIESQEKWISYIKAETNRMTLLVNNLLYLAKTDDIEVNFESSPFNLSDTVRNTVLLMETVAYESGLTLTQHIEPNLIVKGESEKLTQVVKILLDNAIKYSNTNGEIEITLKQSKHLVIFSIKNTSVGISKEHLPKIFDRFYRGSPSRTYDGGYGLGLPIAKAILENMGSKVEVISIEGQTTTFSFALEGRRQ